MRAPVCAVGGSSLTAGGFSRLLTAAAGKPPPGSLPTQGGQGSMMGRGGAHRSKEMVLQQESLRLDWK